MAELRALVVDDSQPLRHSVIYALGRGMGIRCDEAMDGAQALRKFHTERYDIVLTDINMPLMDGLKLIHSIRSGMERQNTPIVVISTESAQEDRDRAMQLGANAYLVKPVQAPRIVAAVKELLQLP